MTAIPAWIEDVKRRLGLIEPSDDAAARLAQWEHDHLTVDDLPAALCAGGRELDTALTLEVYGERVSEVREHPWLSGNEVWLVAPQSPMFGPEPVRCPGCTVMMYPGFFDPSCHYPFCSLTHPPLSALTFTGMIGGI